MMNKLLFHLLVLLITIQSTTGAVIKPTNPLDFVKTSCKTTRHPALCVNSLSTYAGSINGRDQQLAKSAVLVSLNNAKSLTAFLSKLASTSKPNPNESQALKDCINSMASCVSSLTQSVQELGKMGQFKGQNLVWHMNNVETWVSSALTNQNVCAGGFADTSGKVKDAVYKKMDSATQITSNALALVNGFALRHKKGARMAP